MDFTQEQEDKIDELCELGNQAMDNEDYSEAVRQFTAALEYVPEPKNEWEATAWLHASIGDAYFLQSKFKTALNHFAIACNVYGSEPNPFVLLRYGQCFYETGEEKQATNYLLQAYMLEGEEIYEGEEKYFDFLKSKVTL